MTGILAREVASFAITQKFSTPKIKQLFGSGGRPPSLVAQNPGSRSPAYCTEPLS
jgi:hypothetical protein